jgi:hypothetical protein
MKAPLVALVLWCVCTMTFADEKTASISAPGKGGPMAFAAGEIKSALRSAGWEIVPRGPAVLKIMLEAPKGANGNEGRPESFRIDIFFRDSGGMELKVWVRGSDVRGVMYGGLDVAEQIRMHGPLKIKAKSETPFLGVRAMKFNPPLKGTGYMSDEDLKNNAWFYDLDYWDRFMRMMARERYNTLTFWSAHPYDQIVRLRKYPEATTLPAATLDRNIAHFHKLFQMAKGYGLDTYLVTWNIHIAPGFQKAHKVRDGQDSPLIRDYEKECIRELLREYPELTGMGTCPGENMPMSAVANTEWIRDVYLDTLAKTGRKMPFIYRYWGAQPKETAAMLAKANYPGQILLDIKFNGEHIYSSTEPHPEEPRWLTQTPRPYKLLWHLRNDCIFQLRWGDPMFAGKMLSNCGGTDSAGFVIGSEIEIPGADRYHTPQTVGHRDWKYEFEKNWMRFAVWGRMGYNPNEPDSYWIDRFSERFDAAAGKDAFLALKTASKIIPTVTSFHWNYMNGDWYPEGNIGSWNTSAGMKKPNFRDDKIHHDIRDKMFHDVREWIFNNTIDGTMMNVPDYVANCVLKHEKPPAGSLTPLQVAAMLDGYAAESEDHARSVKTTRGSKEWQCTILDLQASAELGHYYAAKIRAAVDLMTYLATGDESRKTAGVHVLENARDFWKMLVDVTKSHYIRHEVWLVGQFDWGMYLPDVEKDVDMARAMRPWPRTEQTWTLPDGRKIAVTTRWQAKGWPRGIEPWGEDFTAAAGSATLPQEVAAGQWIKTTLNTNVEGTGIIKCSSKGVKAIRINGDEHSTTRPAQNGELLIVTKLRSGDNEIAVQCDGTSRTVPIVELEAAPALAVLRAADAQLTRPMKKVDRRQTVSGSVLVVPRGSGRGEKGGKAIDNGWATFTIDIPEDGRYRLNARVFWRNGDCNSFFYAWDDDEPKLLGNDEVFGRWHWVDAEPKALKAGKHTLTIRNREEDSVLDCMTVVPERQR